ncbi:MAG: hypothetical protein ACRDPH_11315 [Marmoricola sp.]
MTTRTTRTLGALWLLAFVAVHLEQYVVSADLLSPVQRLPGPGPGRGPRPRGLPHARIR